MFETLLLERANKEAEELIDSTMRQFTQKRDFPMPSSVSRPVSTDDEDFSPGNSEERTATLLPHMQIPGSDITTRTPRIASEEHLRTELASFREHDQWTTNRSYNDVEWFLKNKKKLTPTQDFTSNDAPMVGTEGKELSSPEGPTSQIVLAKDKDPKMKSASELPQTIYSDRAFEAMFGTSILKKWRDTTKMINGDVEYRQHLDMWAEMPRYTRDMYFLYIIARRRNTYAVIFNIDGKCIHAPMSAGKLGLKHSDKGWRSEGSSETGHIVASKYLDMVYPKLVALENENDLEKNRRPRKNRFIHLVVRVMGFYNGRQGALRALVDRRDKYSVAYMEDITPIPRNGPRMTKSVY